MDNKEGEREDKINKMMQVKKKPQFIRKDSLRISRLGRKRKKLQKWRAAKGRHSKVRQKHKGNVKMPSIGYSQPRKIRGMINGFEPMIIRNIKDVDKANEKNIIIISKTIGKKKRAEILKKIEERKLKLFNKNEIKK